MEILKQGEVEILNTRSGEHTAARITKAEDTVVVVGDQKLIGKAARIEPACDGTLAARQIAIANPVGAPVPVPTLAESIPDCGVIGNPV